MKSISPSFTRKNVKYIPLSQNLVNLSENEHNFFLYVRRHPSTTTMELYFKFLLVHVERFLTDFKKHIYYLNKYINEYIYSTYAYVFFFFFCTFYEQSTVTGKLSNFTYVKRSTRSHWTKFKALYLFLLASVYGQSKIKIKSILKFILFVIYFFYEKDDFYYVTVTIRYITMIRFMCKLIKL